MEMKKRFAVAAVMMCCAMGAQAQMGEDKPPVAVGQQMDPGKALDEMVTQFEHEVMGVARAMPADKYNYAPPANGAIPGAKFTGVRTFAQQVTHIASANYFFGGAISEQKPDVDMKALNAKTSKEDCVKALADSFAYIHQVVATITPANAFESIKGVDGLHTRVEVAAFVSAHGYDHYGQMIEYLRMSGIVPPGSK